MIRIRLGAFSRKTLVGVAGFGIGTVVVVLGGLTGHEMLASAGAGAMMFCMGFSMGACD